LTRLLPGETDWYLGYERLVRAVQRGDELARDQLAPLLSARYPTQLMQAFFDGLLVFVVVWVIARKPRVPGVVGAWMLIVYALGRIPMDLVRLPDSGIAQFGPLTRGQLYSLLMFLGGVAVLAAVSRKKHATRIGGWATRQDAGDAASG
jgi:phosphatidylglycerol:prolipoprotein diacylglycerol transferase